MELQRNNSQINSFVVSGAPKQRETKLDDFMNPGGIYEENSAVQPAATLTRNASKKPQKTKPDNSRTFGYLLKTKDKPLEWVSIRDNLDSMFNLNESILLDEPTPYMEIANTPRDFFTENLVIDSRNNLFFDESSLTPQT